MILVSMAGFPPTGGFLAKFYVFSAAVCAGHLVLALVGVVTSLVSVTYYLRIVKGMLLNRYQVNRFHNARAGKENTK